MDASAKLSGLSAEEARERAARGLSNAAGAPRTKTLASIWLENVCSVFNAIIAAVIAFFLVFYFRQGDGRLLLDCLGVAMVALFNTAIAVVQEIRAKRALDAVRLLLVREVTVVRDMVTGTVAPEDLVLGDVVRLARGEQAAVDGRLLISRRLEMDESLLTGESEPVAKAAGDAVLSGSFCVAGSGYFEVTAVGADAFAAGVAGIARRYKLTPTPLTRRVNALVQSLFASAVILILLSLWRRGDVPMDADFVRRLGAILIALVPQGLVLVNSATFALGVYRISRIGAVVQRLGAIESFAAATVICMDKTGTLTQNRLTVKLAAPLAGELFQADAEKLLGTFAALATEKNSTALALAAYPVDRSVELVDEIAFSSERKMSFLALRRGGRPFIWALGGYDLLLERLSGDDREKAETLYARYGLHVYRALMLVEIAGDTDLEAVRAGGAFSARALCLAAIGDTVREGAGRVIRDFQSRGVRFKILSGDAAPAVAAVCRDIGWEAGSGDTVGGGELETMDGEAFAAACREKTIFARLTPGHKLRIVRALKAAGEHTVMLGDGVNDLPAIKEADLGFAMEEGSQATKEVADIVLLANRFTLLPEILAEGNTIVNSVAAVAKLFLTKNFMVICATLLTLGFALDFPLTPRRVSLLNIFAIAVPAMLTALRNANTEKRRGFLLDVASFAAVSALVMTCGAQAAFFLTRALGGETADGFGAMAMLAAMVALAAVNYVLVAAENRSRRLIVETAYALALVAVFALVCAWPGGGLALRAVRLFYEIDPLTPAAWTGAALAGIGGAAMLVGLQRLRRGWIIRGSAKRKKFSAPVHNGLEMKNRRD
ncbi:MAG: HAD-IC family P-type ATPase [Desulfovibrionaceae bacterium]|nr:HAD-IC family P-type ATPase [Desulfovibrionaceae bacterium]